MHRLDLGLYSHRKEFLRKWNQNPYYLQKQKTKKNSLHQKLREGSSPRRCITQDSEPNTPPTELFRPPQPAVYHWDKDAWAIGCAACYIPREVANLLSHLMRCMLHSKRSSELALSSNALPHSERSSELALSSDALHATFREK